MQYGTVIINERGIYVPKNQDCDRCLRIAQPNDMHALGKYDRFDGPDEWVCTECLCGSRAPWLLK
jgi:hypothetical protein